MRAERSHQQTNQVVETPNEYLLTVKLENIVVVNHPVFHGNVERMIGITILGISLIQHKMPTQKAESWDQVEGFLFHGNSGTK